jgi:cell wall-associated NlpC family hydrolase
VVFAGFAVANSETGCGACTITPRLVAQVCANGMTITRDAMRAVHLGERVEEGIRWSGDTLDRQLTLVTAKARDAVTAFLSPGYVFSGGPDGQVTLNPRVCPAQKPYSGDSSGATGVVQASLDPEQRCVVAAAILYAAAQLGKPYVWGGTGPVGYDCSGLVMMAYRAAGVSLPRTTFQQVYAGTAVYSFSDLMPGDLLFTPGSDGRAEDPGHVSMYVGQGMVIQAPQTGEDIEVTPFKGYWQQNVVAVRRVV